MFPLCGYTPFLVFQFMVVALLSSLAQELEWLDFEPRVYGFKTNCSTIEPPITSCHNNKFDICLGKPFASSQIPNLLSSKNLTKWKSMLERQGTIHK